MLASSSSTDAAVPFVRAVVSEARMIDAKIPMIAMTDQEFDEGEAGTATDCVR